MPHVRVHNGKPSSDLRSAGYIFSREIASRMRTLQEILQPRRDFERRSTGHTTINCDVLMYFTGQDGSTRVSSATSPTRMSAFD
jgi:hypothetical protein